MTLWPACVRTHSVRDQIAAASQAGFSGLAMNSATYVAARETGMSGAQMVRQASDHGVRINWIDAVTGWLPVRYPPRSPELKDFLDHHIDTAFEMASELGAESLLAIGCFDHGAVDRRHQVECFGELCNRAADHDLRVGLEFIPMWGIPTLRAALEIVEAVNASNGGLVFDTWHFFRSDPDMELLGAIPEAKTFAVQMADASWQISGNLLEDCLAHRRLPGEGEFPLGSLIARLAGMGITDFGPEIFSAALDELSAGKAAALCAQSTRKLLENNQINAA